jgi:prepilin-type processing-associated H-X9-DG protein
VIDPEKLPAFSRIPESSVKIPHDMIAIGDATLNYITSRMIKLFYDVDQPTSFSGMGFLDMSIRNQLNLPNSDFSKGYKDANEKRHGSINNVVFCDGHVEGIKEEKLYFKDESSLRRWNNDNEPHRDLVRF